MPDLYEVFLKEQRVIPLYCLIGKQCIAYSWSRELLCTLILFFFLMVKRIIFSTEVRRRPMDPAVRCPPRAFCWVKGSRAFM